MFDTTMFWILAVLAVSAAVTVFVVNSMARATFALLASFLAVGGELLLLGADFLGGVLILMLAGEMIIMAVFMIMYMMNPGGLMPMSMVHNHRFAIGAAAATFLVLATGILLTPWPQPTTARPADAFFQLGEALFGSKMLVMMTIGVGLFTTMVAGILLATGRGRYDRYGDDLDRGASDPVPVGRRRPR
jgi:NADH:ubiquinone oxidoreductase subunit 6 (subunit J)